MASSHFTVYKYTFAYLKINRYRAGLFVSYSAETQLHEIFTILLFSKIVQFTYRQELSINLFLHYIKFCCFILYVYYVYIWCYMYMCICVLKCQRQVQPLLISQANFCTKFCQCKWAFRGLIWTWHWHWKKHVFVVIKIIHLFQTNPQLSDLFQVEVISAKQH